MSGWRLTLMTPPALRVDAAALQPAALAALGEAELSRFTLPMGRDALPLAELFAIEALDGEGTRLELEGDFSHFDRLGAGMAEGLIDVKGDVGHHAGVGMTGGRLQVFGGAGDLLACAMSGGRIDLAGDAGDFVASALPGDMDGMRGGTVVIGGDAGARLADRMRRGTVVVHGRAGDFAASRMVAGTLAIGGGVGHHLGYGMRRGSVLLAGPKPAAPSIGFVPVRSNADVFWQLLARDLAAFGGHFASLPQRRFSRFAGDVSVQGKGELLIPE